MAAACVESLFLVVACFILAGDDSTTAAALYAALSLYVSASFLLFTVDAAMTENRFQHSASLLASLILTATVIFKVFNEPQDLGKYWLEYRWWICGIKIFFQVVYLALWYPAWDSFGFFAYKIASSSVLLQDLYSNYRLFLTLLKLDFFFGILLLLMVKFFLFSEWNAQMTLDTIGLCLTLVWTLLGWSAATLEKRGLMIVFLLLSPLQPAYVVSQLIYYDDHKDLLPEAVTINQFMIMGCLAIAVRGGLLYASVRVYLGFGQGLLMRVFAKANTRRRPLSQTAAHPVGAGQL